MAEEMGLAKQTVGQVANPGSSKAGSNACWTSRGRVASFQHGGGLGPILHETLVRLSLRCLLAAGSRRSYLVFYSSETDLLSPVPRVIKWRSLHELKLDVFQE